MPVFVLDRRGRPFMPCGQKRALRSLASGHASAQRLHPFVIRIIDMAVEQSTLQPPLHLWLDPESRSTGISLPPLSTPVDAHAGELPEPATHIRFLMEIEHSGDRVCLALYSRAPLRRTCSGRKRTPDCRPCNTRRDTRDARDFLADEPARFERVFVQAKVPLRDTAAINASVWALSSCLKATGLPMGTGANGSTKYKRSSFDLTKSHALDPACLGMTNSVGVAHPHTLEVRCSECGVRQRPQVEALGVQHDHLVRDEHVKDFATGDHVRALVSTTHKKAKTHVGRVAVRSTGSFNTPIQDEPVRGSSRRHCHLLTRGDGFGYTPAPVNPCPPTTKTARPPSLLNAAGVRANNL